MWFYLILQILAETTSYSTVKFCADSLSHYNALLYICFYEYSYIPIVLQYDIITPTSTHDFLYIM